MNPIVYAIPIFMVTVVIEAIIAWRKGRPLYSAPDALTSLHLGVFSQLSGAFLKAVSFGIYVLVWNKYRLMELPEKSVFVWIGALLAYDFAYYFGHRCGHEVNFMWAGHVVHHSSEYFNLSTALRQSATTSLYSWAFYIPLAVAGVSPLVFGVVGLIDLLYQYWVHTELIGSLGWLDRILVTPSNHRVHHGQNDYCIDCNYGGILIIWDRLLGTFVEERKDEPVVYGIRKPLASYDPVWGNLHVYADIARTSLAAEGWRAKLLAWFAPPARQAALGEAPPPFDVQSFRRYNPATRAEVSRYALGQYVVLVFLVSHFIAVSPALSLSLRAIYAVGLLGSMMVIGALLQGRALARRIEQVRVVVFGVLFAATPIWFGYEVPVYVKAAVLVFTLICAGWLSRMEAPVQVRGALA